ncbi:MAG TPA: hypothetical protein PLR34_06065 [Bacteroidales bacterium]|nr:hypothetical protein [Bacteroidales bacterium]MCZ2416046.1 hypothetical protein [Burkholderiales bacterium]OQC57322.1 MAG: hypothetical protein BWX52_01120 [Bacteroidetes bacterium ADurb.Bin013]MCZ2316346.1 hypothetical protein [Bacteroidales bacterium]HNR28550.1 hypothetical protein [Bacteroidales bacterium]
MRLTITHYGAWIALLAFVSCGTPRLGTYSIRLQDAESIPVAPTRDMMLSTAEQPDGTTRYVYENPMFRITWSLTNTRFGFILDNLTADTLFIDWDKASYLDQDGDTLRLIHDGVDFFLKDSIQEITPLEPLGSLEDFLLPASNIHYDPDNYTLWRINHLFYDRKGNIGQRVSVELPLEINRIIYRYRFRFTIDDWKADSF